MALIKNQNSYLTVEEADAYLSDRLDAAAWTQADATMKAQALVTASRMLNDYSWTGTAISDTQQLAFPRDGEYYDPLLGVSVNLSTVPSRILNATCELAYHLLNNDGLLDDTGELDSLTVGSISLDFKVTPSKVSDVVYQLVKPIMKTTGSRHWWRSN